MNDTSRTVDPADVAAQFPGPTDPTPFTRHPPREDRNRVTVTGVVYHHAKGGSPTAVESRHSYWCEGGLPAFANPRAECDGGWRPVELGWFVREPVGLVLIRCNDSLAGRATIPSREERDAAAARVLDVCLGRSDVGDPRAPDLTLRPGEELRLPNPARPTLVLVRCPAGPATYSVTAFPR